MTIHTTTGFGRRVASVAAIFVLSAGALAACGSDDTDEPSTHDASMHSSTTGDAAASQPEVIALHSAMSTLWADHMQYTFATVNAFFNNQKALQPNLDRLLQNQKDLGAAIEPFYGQEAGDKLAALLSTHIEQAVPVLTAAKNGDDAALKKSLADWHANAKDIADFLSAANPKQWPTSATEPMMKMHIDQTTTYAVDLLKGDYAKAIKDYDEAFAHMMEMATTLANGIVAQYPDKF